MSPAKVSIITRTRNRPRFLERAMASVLGQTGAPDWEWIVVNDAGDPQTVESVLQPALQRCATRIQILHLPESKGMEHASNAGIARTTGSLLAIHDDDDSWDPCFLREMRRCLEAHPQAAGVVCHSIRIVEQVRDNRIEELHRHSFNSDLEALSFWRVLQENPFPPISFLFTREAYTHVGPFDESLPVLGDWEFNLRILSRYPLVLLPRELALYHHRTPEANAENANSISRDDRHRTVEKALRNRWKSGNPFGMPDDVMSAAATISRDLHRMKTGLARLSASVERLEPEPPPQF